MNTELRRQELANMKVAELKALASEYQFTVSGKKAEIIEQILDFEWDLNDEELQATNEDYKHFEIIQMINSLKEMSNEEKVEIINSISGENKTLDDILKEAEETQFAQLMEEANVNIISLAKEGDAGIRFLANLRGMAQLFVSNDTSNAIINVFIKYLRYRIEELECQTHKQEHQVQKDVQFSSIDNLITFMNTKDGKPFMYEHVADRPLLQQILLHVCRALYLDSQRAIKVANGNKEVKQFGPVYVGKKHSGLHMKDSMAKGMVKAAAEKVLPKELQKKFITLNTETKHTEFKQAVQVLDKLHDAGLIHGEETDKEYAKFYTVYPDEILAFLQAVGCLKK